MKHISILSLFIFLLVGGSFFFDSLFSTASAATIRHCGYQQKGTCYYSSTSVWTHPIPMSVLYTTDRGRACWMSCFNIPPCSRIRAGYKDIPSGPTACGIGFGNPYRCCAPR